MPIYSHLHGDEDHQHPYPPHHHHHHPHDPYIISPLGIGPRGEDGEKGEKGDPFTFDDFTSEQLADLRDGVSTVYYRKTEAAYTTSGTLTSSIEIPVSYTDHDMLFIDIEGLDISEGADYTINGNTIVLTEPITHAGTRVNFTVLSAVAADAEDLEEFWNSIADATVDSRGLMSAADKAKLDGIPENASAVSLQVVTTDQPHGRIVAYEPGGAYSIMDVPVLDRSNHVQEANLPTMSETVKGAAMLGDGLEISGSGVLGIASKVLRAYMTVSDMCADTGLAAGMICHTNGFHAEGDGGAAYYVISADGTANGMDVLALQGGLNASFMQTESFVNLAQLGAHGDNSTDDADVINHAFETYGNVQGIHGAEYLIGSTIYISTANSFDGNGCTFYASGSFESETRTHQPSLIAIFVQGDGTLPKHKSIGNFTLRESSDVSGLTGMYVGAAEAYSSQASTNGIAVLTRRFENITIVGFETGLFVSEAWDCNFDTIMVRASRTACCDIKGQSVNNRFDNCGFYGYAVSSYALRFAFNDYYSLRSEGNTFTSCFIGEATTGIYVSHTLGDSFIGCIIDLNSGHAIHDAAGAEMTYTNCYIQSTLVDASIVNGGTIYLAGLGASDPTIKSSFIGCNIINSGSGANSVIILANRLSDSFINCYIDKPIRAVQAPTKTIVIGCTFAGSGNSAIYAYSASRYVALGNVGASDGSKLFDNGFSDFTIKSGTTTATTGTGGEISLHHEAGLTFYCLIANVTSSVAHHIVATNNGANYSYLIVYGANGNTVPNTEVTFNYVIIGK